MMHEILATDKNWVNENGEDTWIWLDPWKSMIDLTQIAFFEEEINEQNSVIGTKIHLREGNILYTILPYEEFKQELRDIGFLPKLKK